jgi:glycerol-3-phosphate acyltransferase PlsY
MIDTILNHIQMEGLIGLVAGYFFGAIPFGLVLCYLAGYGDIRKIGSGNIGATNVLRTGNKWLALLTLILDSSKGAIAVLVANHFLGLHGAFGAALGSVIGHNFPVYLMFKGGKGVATAFGVLLVLSWPVALASAATWLVTALLFRISSLAAIVAVAMSPVFVMTIGRPQQVYMIGTIALLILIRHHANIRRLLKGEEPKISFKKKT